MTFEHFIFGGTMAFMAYVGIAFCLALRTVVKSADSRRTVGK